MKVQAFIPTWPGDKQHPEEIVQIVSPCCEVCVMDNPEHYFNDQWEEMRNKFTGDIMLWIMADVTLHSFPEMYKEMLRLMSRDDVGIYAPNVCWTGHVYDISKLIEIEPQVCEVAMTDMLCYAVRADVLSKLPRITTRTHGWGIEIFLTALATKMGRKTVRDYRFTVDHPNSTGYCIPEAASGMEELIAHSGIEKEMRSVMELRDKQHV